MTSENPKQETADTFYNKPATEEPLAPTEEAVTTQENLEPEQEAKSEDKPEEIEDKTGDESEELEAKDEGEESQFITLDDKEIDLEDVRKWRDGHLMQSDYTKKTTELSTERKTFETERDSERENLLQEKTEVSEMRDLLSVLVTEDEEINWVELKEDDPDRYIELKELADKRKDALEKVRIERETPADDPVMIQAEKEKLVAANPEWLDEEGNETDAYKADTKLIAEYSLKAGFSNEEFKNLTRAHHMTTILKAAKYDALQEKGREIKLKRAEVPVTTKPKAKKQTSTPKPAHEVFYGK